MKNLFILVLLSCSLFGEDKSKELEDAKARIIWLEKKLDAMTNKSNACFNLYAADATLNSLVKSEPVIKSEEKSEEKK